MAWLALFGSVARDESGIASDVDLLVDFARPPGFDGYMALKFRLEEILGCSVDLVKFDFAHASLLKQLRPVQKATSALR